MVNLDNVVDFLMDHESHIFNIGLIGAWALAYVGALKATKWEEDDKKEDTGEEQERVVYHNDIIEKAAGIIPRSYGLHECSDSDLETDIKEIFRKDYTSFSPIDLRVGAYKLFDDERN